VLLSNAIVLFVFACLYVEVVFVVVKKYVRAFLLSVQENVMCVVQNVCAALWYKFTTQKKTPRAQNRFFITNLLFRIIFA